MRAWIPRGRMMKISIIRNSGGAFPVVLTPRTKPDGAMEGFGVLAVLCDNCVGTAQGVLRGRVGAKHPTLHPGQTHS